MLLIFSLGALIGMLIGQGICIRYLRREIAADIGPKLRYIQSQLNNLEAAINLELVSRYTHLRGDSSRIRPRLASRQTAMLR